ncbi:hypothetical protein GCM10011571_25120 [Marinithermofilum abyssi]|uniref:NurA domain-containing protein n=1 Tax=Marinithermofilum abyssi TaxID=1571185 RepID=A0A8J2VGT0_9BACL|nr:DNA double-strand break repair nuclease NurA [Marinithermofilum abyssi]GGE21994.1 hypothetical protein GCM10011571_25120 [Marinithermofilum abyssi]
MLPVSEALKRKFAETNRELRLLYPEEELRKEWIREQLEEYGTFYPMEKWPADRLTAWLDGRVMAGVDGSVNSTPGTDPHTLSVFQALAKGTHGEECWEADLYTPLLDREGTDPVEGRLAREAKRRGTLLAGLELKVAKEAIIRWRPRVIMMDGSLLHYLIDDPQGWEELAELALARGVLLVGISEEIGTRGLARLLFPQRENYSDRDVLFGVLQPGEAYESEAMQLTGTGLWKAVMCSSRSPQPVGIDGLLSQAAERENLLNLIHTMTPAQGRGIPLWLDIVDKEVRVTDPLVRAMVEQFIDPDLRHRLLVPKRSERHL